MFKGIMINKVSNNIVDKMGTLVSDNGQWSSKPCKYVFL
jgi:hypothetical protein